MHFFSPQDGDDPDAADDIEPEDEQEPGSDKELDGEPLSESEEMEVDHSCRSLEEDFTLVHCLSLDDISTCTRPCKELDAAMQTELSKGFGVNLQSRMPPMNLCGNYS